MSGRPSITRLPSSAGSLDDPQRERLPGRAELTRIELIGGEVVGVRAPNPGPFTLEGTNSWLIGRNPTWLLDPGPALGEHLDALADEIRTRGGLGGTALTHDHPDHAESVPAIRERFPDVPVAASRGQVDIRLGDGDRFGPLQAMAAPGHSPDHLVFLAGRLAFTGDAVLGRGSTLLIPFPGALVAYLGSLERLRERDLETLAPGHGPPVFDVRAKLDEYIEHRLDRERRLLAALARGRRTVSELLDDAWSDAPPALRPAATATLAAHLDKLADEGRLPDGVQRPEIRLGAV
jgi:glyoxylase-like metal-dependent hydrolase (beta-lactamase superfamily II)